MDLPSPSFPNEILLLFYVLQLFSYMYSTKTVMEGRFCLEYGTHVWPPAANGLRNMIHGSPGVTLTKRVQGKGFWRVCWDFGHCIKCFFVIVLNGKGGGCTKILSAEQPLITYV